MTELAGIRFNLNQLEEALGRAVAKGLATKQIKDDMKAITSQEIEKVVVSNKDLFRPDAGPGGGDELVGQLGIGVKTGESEGRPLTERYDGNPNAAWSQLRPGTDSAKVRTFFRAARRGKFAEIAYEINLDQFFNNFRAIYVGSNNLKVSWMQNLIDGVPTAQEVDYPEGVTGYAFVDTGPDLRDGSSRTGFGHMVALERLTIPSQQFSFPGRGRPGTFGKLLSDVERKLKSSDFKKKLEVRIAKSINSGV
jgi:hypothetical protein